MTAEDPRAVRRYEFRTPAACIMCGTPAAEARVLGLRLSTSQGLRPRGKRGVAVTVCRCRTCGLVFADPQPWPERLTDHYDVPPEEYWRSADFSVPPGYFARQIETARALLGPDRALRAIDIGVGLGRASRVMRDAGFAVRGVEPSAPFRARALEILGDDPDSIQLATAEEAVFPPGEADFVTFGAVLEHLRDPAMVIERALGWLRPGGIIHAEVPNARHLMARLINGWFRLIGTSFVTQISPMHAPYHLYEFTLDSFARHGARAGYDVAAHWVDVCSIRHVPAFTRPLLGRIMAATDTGMQLTLFLRKAG